MALALALAALYLGSTSVLWSDSPRMPATQFVRAFRGDQGISSTIVYQWRMPRVVAALAFGAALGVSGALFQTLTRNNLGSPDILGFSTGAYTGVLLLTIGLGTGGVALAGSTSAESGAAGTSDDAPFLLTAVSSLGTAGAALIGGVLTAVVVYVLAFKDGIHGFRLIIVGIAVSALLQAVNTYLLLTASEEVAMGASIWGAGTLSLVSWSSLLPVLVVLAVLVPVIGLSVRALHQLELGDDMAAAHGVGVERVRRRILLAGVVLVAVTTALSGPIAFIALSAPQIARRTVRAPGIPLLASALTGSALLVAADLCAQQALPTTVPVGLITVIIGGVYLVALLGTETVRALRRRPV